MTLDDAARADLHAFMQQTVPPDARSSPPTRCPRCARGVDPADLLTQPLVELRLIDPHVARYDRQTADGCVAICDDCDQQLAAIALEMDTQRQRLTRLWPRPTSPRERLLDDQRLSRAFEEIRDLHIEDVLGWAVWHDRRGHDAYLVVYETGTWTIQPVPRGQVYDDLDDRGYLALLIPVAPPVADARREADGRPRQLAPPSVSSTRPRSSVAAPAATPSASPWSRTWPRASTARSMHKRR